jgi:chromosome segregation protein
VRIKSLTLHGFKSFADRTRIDLHDGVTAVVGPNGCGKSNISDALRWVLGEQRPTAIRGSRMEEAIFGGTEARRPIHRAEVSLELSNEDGILPLPYSEVVVGRTVYRGGESEYTINGGACRLRDILDLCRDTGLGANAYAIMEGRMIDSILSDRAEERRALFEEAAEVGRYKDRRRTALRRLEQSETDLQRLDDVLNEVHSKVRSLAQQRGRAERYGRLRERLLQLEVAVAGARLAWTRERLATAEVELSRLVDVRSGEETGLQTAETEAETLRIGLAEQEHERSRLARELETARQQLESRERERLVAAERVSAAEERIATLSRELEELTGRKADIQNVLETAAGALDSERAGVDDLTGRERALLAEVESLAADRETAGARADTARRTLDSLTREISLLESEIEAAEQRDVEWRAENERRRAELEELGREEAELSGIVDRAAEQATAAGSAAASIAGKLAELREAIEQKQAEVRELREEATTIEGELIGARARAESLSGFVASANHLPEIVGALIAAKSSVNGVEGVLADAIRAPSSLAAAVEARLGPYLHGVVVRDWKTVDAVRRWLADRGSDEGLLLLPLKPGPRPVAGSEGSDRSAALPSLLEQITLEGPGAPWARVLLRDVGIESGEAFDPASTPWVKPDGTGQDEWGAVHIGHGGRKGVVSQRAELELLHGRTAQLEAKWDKIRGARETAEAELAEAISQAESLEREAGDSAVERRKREAESADAESRLGRIASEQSAIRERMTELESLSEAARERAMARKERLSEIKAEVATVDAETLELRTEAGKAHSAWEERRGMLHELQLRMARREADLSAATDTLRRAEEALTDLVSRESRHEAERATLTETIKKGRQSIQAGEEELESLLHARRGIETRLREAEERVDATRLELASRETALRETRRTEREHLEQRHALELEVTELKAGQATILERLEAEWDADLDELSTRVEPLETGGLEEWESELDTVRRSLARIGPVNLLAQEEFTTEQERLTFLTEQRDDLVEARDDLRESIRRINRTAAATFTETFDEIRDNFVRTFQTLFEGGECDVWLEDPDDPLDSPIEISASPRGKRTQRIHLLSGGERALTALALLFAIYLTKPSPVCLMDEVDAPLDETNILRFVNMVQQFKSETQFVIITHNARTIEAADWIYGVTMQEPGVSSVVGVELGEASHVA